MTTRAKQAAALAAVLAIGAGTVTASAEQGGATPPEAQAAAGAGVAPATVVQYAESSRFGELRRPRSGDDALPPRWNDQIGADSRRGSRWGADTAESRRAAPQVWLVPGNGFLCVANVSPGDGSLGFGCATPAQVEQGLLQPADVDQNGNGVVTGVMPDGVTSVTLVNDDGSTQAVAVSHNVYQAAVDSRLLEVRWTDSAGIGHVRPMAWTP
jgi:hypothetical protein